jgi:hypothetical protein
VLSSRADHARLVKLLLRDLAATAAPAGDPVDRDADGNPRWSWTARELAAADRYVLDVTVRNGPLGPAELELRLVVDDGWEPHDDDEDDYP